MKTILIGTANLGKVTDFKPLFMNEGIAVKSLHDLEKVIDVEETGNTFEENAILKAEALSRYYGQVVIADDSGLAVEALGGKPGVYSARYAGIHKSDKDNIKKVLAEMEGIPYAQRKAAFVCVLALAAPEKETVIFKGTCNGYITEEPRGGNGFGYDPIFYVPEMDKTMAEMSTEEKNAISHRRKALDQLKQFWRQAENDYF